jgi:hypothetical protein
MDSFDKDSFYKDIINRANGILNKAYDAEASQYTRDYYFYKNLITVGLKNTTEIEKLENGEIRFWIRLEPNEGRVPRNIVSIIHDICSTLFPKQVHLAITRVGEQITFVLE